MSTTFQSSIDYRGDIVNERWRVEQMIGSGAYGWVYKATDQSGGQSSVVIKFAEANTEEEFASAQRCLRREYRALRHLNRVARHLRVPKVYEHGTHRDTNYVVMERLGVTVNDWLAGRSQPVSSFTILRICNQVYNIIRRMHEKNVAHNDISLHNIMFERGQGNGGNLYVIDFGNAGSNFWEAARDDLAALCDIMVKMFRNSQTGLFSEEDRACLGYGDLTRDERRKIYANLHRAYRFREREGVPIPQAVRSIVRMLVDGEEINYSELGRLFRQALCDARDQRR